MDNQNVQPNRHLFLTACILIGLIGLAFGGYYLWRPKDSNTQEHKNNSIAINSDPEIWKEVSKDGLTNVSDTSCGFTIAMASTCLEQMFYIPKNDTFTSESQFGVKVNVFAKTDDSSVQDWYVREILGGTLSDLTTVTNLTINGLSATQFKTEIEDDIYKTTVLHYAIDTGDGKAVVLHSRLQQPITENTTEIDYSNFQDDVMKLAESISTS